MKKNILYVIALLISAVGLLASCGGKKNEVPVSGGDSLKGEVSLSGAFALYPLVVRWADEFKKLHPNVTIDISAGGAGKGITDALTGQVDLGMVSRELKQAEVEQGALGFAVAMDAVVATVNMQNPVLLQLKKRGLSQTMARRLWLTDKVHTWGQVVASRCQYPVHVYTRSDACGAAETWALYLGTEQENLQGTGVYGDPAIAQQIQKDALGIGMNNIGYAFDLKTGKTNPGIAVVPIDRNGNGRVDADENFYASLQQLIEAIAQGKYPTPPARNLYLVSNGRPKSKAVRAFLKYILTEGQKYNVRSGFIQLNDTVLKKELQKM